uniref:Uncharacterized protein n=1 Tax=Aegilops tauschii subsp. strangulata TaxID=200361 RepID=A0A453RVV1_AEGTS
VRGFGPRRSKRTGGGQKAAPRIFASVAKRLGLCGEWNARRRLLLWDLGRRQWGRRRGRSGRCCCFTRPRACLQTRK